ncbi:hypothetical protein [Novosphingobium colocasiae]|uniref:hypothetical protein n=1 Tax=Novosphingobium colocasiae TaxID=1256513 RepID=UPI0035AE25BA
MNTAEPVHDRDHARKIGGYRSGAIVNYCGRRYRSLKDANMACPFNLDWWQAL